MSAVERLEATRDESPPHGDVTPAAAPQIEALLGGAGQIDALARATGALKRPRDPLSVEFVECQKDLMRHLGHDAKAEETAN